MKRLSTIVALIAVALTVSVYGTYREDRARNDVACSAGEPQSQPEVWLCMGDDKEKGYITEYSSNNCDKESDVGEWLFRQHK